jgi:predicted DNA-binding protein with PD1-like motif
MNRFTTVFGAWVALFFSLDGVAMLLLAGRHLYVGRDWTVGEGVDPLIWTALAGILLLGGACLGFFLGMPDSELSLLVRQRAARRRQFREGRSPAAKPAKVAKPKAEIAVVAKAKPEEAHTAKQVWSGGGEHIHVLVLEPGAEAFAAITAFARDKNLKAASLTAIGAFDRATVGWFNAQTKTYEPIEVDEQCEVLSLIGDVATGDDGKASLHIHAVLGLRDGSTRGGHLLKATVRPTLEVVVTETPAHLRRRMRPEIGAALIDLGG